MVLGYHYAPACPNRSSKSTLENRFLHWLMHQAWLRESGQLPSTLLLDLDPLVILLAILLVCLLVSGRRLAHLDILVDLSGRLLNKDILGLDGDFDLRCFVATRRDLLLVSQMSAAELDEIGDGGRHSPQPARSNQPSRQGRLR